MSSDWYCRVDQKVYGPLGPQDLKQMAQTGKLRPTDLVKKTEAGKWVSANSVKGLSFKTASEAVAQMQAEPICASASKTCPSCQANLPANSVLCVQCGFDIRTGKKVILASAPKNIRRKVIIVGSIAAGTLFVASVALYFLVLRQNHPPQDDAVRKLLAQIGDVSDANVQEYEKMLERKDFLSVLLFEGTLPSPRAEIAEVRKLGLEKSAVSALLKVIQDNRNSENKKNALVCGQAVSALGQLGLAANEAIPTLKELTNHREVAVASKAKGAIEAIQDAVDGADLQARDPESYRDREKLQGTWNYVTFEATGPGNQNPEKEARMTFTGGRVSISARSLHARGPYHLNATKRPKEIDFIDPKGKENLFGVYALDLEGDTLTICVGKQRPKGLSIQNETFAILFVLKKGNRPPSTGKSAKETPDSKFESPQKKVKITQALYQKILAGKMTEAQVTEILGAGRISNRPFVPPDMRELIWEDSLQNSISIQFKDGKAHGGQLKIYENKK